MRRTLFCLFLVACVAAAGCTRNHYRVRMTPTDSGFDRSLACWMENTGEDPNPQSLSSEELTKLEACYGSPPRSEEEGRNVFRGKFAVEAPQDVGGTGRLERIDTSLGNLYVYVERFRGNDDLEAELNRRREAIDTVVDLTLDWLRKELGHEENFRQLEAFVDIQVRNDLKNLAIYSWGLLEKVEGGGVLERLWLYLRERDYLTFQDTVMIVRAFQTQEPTIVQDIVIRMIARELEVDANSDALAIFRDPQRLGDSFEEHVRTSAFYTEYLEAWRKEHDESDEEEPPEPGGVIAGLLLETFILFSLPPDDALEVTLDAECEPISTNGEWNGSKKTVTWNADLNDGLALPTVCAATWAVPNQDEQRRRFGRVLLSGQDLAGYAMWYESLSEEEAKQWGKVLADCRAGKSWQETVKAFEFEEKTPAKKLLAERVKNLLIEEVEEE